MAFERSSASEDLAGYKQGLEPVTSKDLSIAPHGETGLDRGPIAPGDTSTATITDDDQVDTFSVDLVAGETYVFSLRGSGAAPLADTYLALLGPDLAPLVHDDDGGAGTNSLVTFTATETGTYTLVASAYPDSGLVGDYTVDVRQLGADSVPEDLTSTVVLAEGVTLGALETGTDVDVYELNVTAGTLYTLTLDGGWDYASDYSLLEENHELDTVLTVYDADGNVVFSNDDIGQGEWSSRLSFLAEEDATYYVEASAYPGPVAGYTLGLESQLLSDLDPLTSIDWGTSLPSSDVTVYFARAGEAYDGFTSQGWTPTERSQVMSALQSWAAVTDLTFTITTDPLNATFHMVTTPDLGAGVIAYMNPPGETNEGVGVFATSGDIWTAPGSFNRGGYGYYAVVHEIGHALGLAHPHDTGGGSDVMAGVDGPFNSYGVYDLNQGVYTVMSYNPGFATHPGADFDGFPPGFSLDWGLQAGPGAFDIAIVQARYGADDTRNDTNTVYELPAVNAAGTYFSTIWDTGGADTIVYNGTGFAQIDLTAATLDYTPTGGGVVSYASGVFGGFTIAHGVVIENATGGSGRDLLVGNAAENRLDGRSGADTMIGRTGNDTYVVNTRKDVVVEAADEGIDTVETGINNYALADFVERLRLTGSDDIAGYGNAMANVLWGNDGHNRLDGGAGADDMHGGLGNDIFVVDDAGDRAFEDAGEGVDRVDASVSYSLAGQSIEALRLTGTGDIDATGNTLDNRLIGNGGNNVLNGGAGADEMRGGFGDDRYVIDNAADVIVEAAGEGTDTIATWISYNLMGLQIEQLTLLGSADLSGGGNNFDNLLVGNTGDNILNGGLGSDAMAGGAGDDWYIVDNVGDTVAELAGEGSDRVDSSVSFSLAGQAIESLALSGIAALDGTGNGLANTLTGNDGANLLDGGYGDDALHGGLGADTLVGNRGLDSFWFETALGAGNVDTIADFKAADDTIYLDRSIFTGIAANGALAAGAFRQGAVALDADDRILYDKVNGDLYYDADGAGGAAAVLFAHVAGSPSMTAADFFAVA